MKKLKYKIGISLVLYKESKRSFERFLEKLSKEFSIENFKILVFLNSKHDFDFPKNILVFYSIKNIGYGKGHNHNFNWFKKNNYDKVIISNTDLSFKGDFTNFIGIDDRVIVGPKIISTNNKNQKVTRSLPTILDKLISFFSDYPYFVSHINRPTDVPHISGCFFMINIKLYSKLGYEWIFDPIFFMYEEDTDLCRRMWGVSPILYNPNFTVIHHYKKGSSKKLNLFFFHFVSIIKYFKKWGIFDKEAIKSRNLVK